MIQYNHATVLIVPFMELKQLIDDFVALIEHVLIVPFMELKRCCSHP